MKTHQPVPNLVQTNVKSKRWTFPWWFLFIAYGISVILFVVSTFFIIVRGIEFGDVKTQKWLTSAVTSFFSSILVVQPLKVETKEKNSTIENVFLFRFRF